MAKKNTKKEAPFWQNISPNMIILVLAAASIIAAFFIGSLSREVQFYKQNMAGLETEGRAENDEVDTANGPLANPDVDKPTEDDFIRGNPDATFALVEYSDYDCPFCDTFHNTAIQFLDETGDEVMWIYRHFPLYGLHPNAEAKAIASECAALQGGDDAFWLYSDELFARQDEDVDTDAELTALLTDIAGNVGLDVAQFTSCYENEETIDRVREDIASAEKAGVRGTPGNFLLNLENGNVVPLQGAVPLEVLQNAYDAFK